MLLDLQHINFSFLSANPVFKNFSFSLDKSKVYALMGSNGAGKTTLFNLITGFIRPQSGDISFNGNNITRQQPYKINLLGIGRTFQDLRLATKLTVKENIILAMKHNPGDNWLNAMLPQNFYHNAISELDKKAEEMIAQFFLSDVKNILTAEISYGQQKLLSLACCVANGANLLLLDEAVAGVQPVYRNKIAILIKQLKEEGKTILLVEHNTDFIAEVANKIFFLTDGEMLAFDNMEALKKNRQVMEAYI